MLRAGLLASLGLLLAASPSTARIWFVTPDGAGDAPTILAAIDSAVAALDKRRRRGLDTVLVFFDAIFLIGIFSTFLGLLVFFFFLLLPADSFEKSKLI